MGMASAGKMILTPVSKMRTPEKSYTGVRVAILALAKIYRR